MSEKNEYRNRIELLQGTLDLLILQTLQWGPRHGYGIVQALRLRSREVLQVETGSLYPALHRLERQGWVRSEWKTVGERRSARLIVEGQGQGSVRIQGEERMGFGTARQRIRRYLLRFSRFLVASSDPSRNIRPWFCNRAVPRPSEKDCSGTIAIRFPLQVTWV
jgi:hypothetical protein